MPLKPSMDQTSSLPSSSSAAAASSTVRLGGRAIDRHNPIIRDGRRFTPPPSPNPKSSSHHDNRTIHQTPQKTKLGLEIGGDHQERFEEQIQATKTKKNKKKKNKKGFGKLGPTTTTTITTTPQGSSRYLLDHPVFFDGFVDSEPVPVPIEPVFTDGFADSDPVKVPVVDDGLEKIEPGFDYKEEERLVINASKYLTSSFLEKKQPDFFDGFLDYDPVLSPDNNNNNTNTVSDVPTRSSPSESCRQDKHVTTPGVHIQSEKKPSSDQVVVLRVSLHCKGCAGKVRKHLSRMKGVTSFNVDFAAKKVTVTGDVTPLGVLASVSKVKNAQFWPETNK